MDCRGAAHDDPGGPGSGSILRAATLLLMVPLWLPITPGRAQPLPSLPRPNSVITWLLEQNLGSGKDKYLLRGVVVK